MEDNKATINSIDEYIAQFPTPVREKLSELRLVISEAAPGAYEKLSWQMPTFMFRGILVQFAAHKNHIGFYPGPDAIEVFKDRLCEYKLSKGTIKFPIDKPLPCDLIIMIVKFKANENIAREEGKHG